MAGFGGLNFCTDSGGICQIFLYVCTDSWFSGDDARLAGLGQDDVLVLDVRFEELVKPVPASLSQTPSGIPDTA